VIKAQPKADQPAAEKVKIKKAKLDERNFSGHSRGKKR
jgi:hypothetical protein